MLHHGRIDGQHEDVVADRLEVVRGPVALRVALEVEHRLATVGSHRQVAAEAAGDPGCVAALTRHARVGVRELTGLAVLGNGGAPGGTVAAERLGEAGSIVSATCVTVHCRPSVTIDRWVSASPSHWNRRWPNGVRRDDRSVPPAGAAGPDVLRVARCWIVP